MDIVGFLKKKKRYPFPPHPNFSHEDCIPTHSISRVHTGSVPVSLIIGSGIST